MGKEAEDAQPPPKFAPLAWTTFPTWEAVGAWYRGVIAGRDAVTPALQAKADELTAQAKTDTERVTALYEYVAGHNHYIGIDFGIGRYQPHRAAEVLTNQYGDCKDKHTLLAALLRAKGFEASAVLIGLGVELNDKVPMPAAFNHLITLVNVDHTPVWLDTTTEVAPYRVLLSILRDKQALVVPPSAAPHLAKTPAELPFPAMNRYEGTFELAKDGTTKGNATVMLRGDDELVTRAAFRQTPRGQWDQLTQAYVGTSFFGTGSATVVDGQDVLSIPWKMHYAYAQEAWSEWKNFKIGPLLPNVLLPTIDEKKPPKTEIDLGGLRTQWATSTVRLPEGFSVELPNAIHLKTAFARFDQTYEVNQGSLVSEFKLETLRPKLDATEWKAVKKFVDDIGTTPWIQVTSKQLGSEEKGPPPAGENNPVAADLVRQAADAIQAKDFDLAWKKSDEAVSVNEKQPGLWSQRGYLASLRDDFEESVFAYKKELQLHPNESEVYPGLLFAIERTARKTGLRQALMAYAKAAPGKDSVALQVGARLMADDDAADAIEVYGTASRALPENKVLQVNLATALLRSGKAEEAATIAQKALGGSDDAGVLNDGAYVLATAKSTALLPLAESSAKKAVEMLEIESGEITLAQINARSFQRTILLLASWDTLGWIYFMEAKEAPAAAYVEAAWKSRPDAEVGLHWGQILEKRGEKQSAMAVYEMALSGVRGVSSPVTVELHTRVDALTKNGIGMQAARPDASLQEQRTFHLPRAKYTKGSAIFALQVSAQKTEKMEMISGDEILRGMGPALAKLDLGLKVPNDPHALLLRSGVLFCSTQATCEFVLTPPETANVR